MPSIKLFLCYPLNSYFFQYRFVHSMNDSLGTWRIQIKFRLSGTDLSRSDEKLEYPAISFHLIQFSVSLHLLKKIPKFLKT